MSNISPVVDEVEKGTCSASELFLVNKSVGVSYISKGHLDVTRKVRTFLTSSSIFLTDTINCEKELYIALLQLLRNPTGRHHQHTSTSPSSIGNVSKSAVQYDTLRDLCQAQGQVVLFQETQNWKHNNTASDLGWSLSRSQLTQRRP